MIKYISTPKNKNAKASIVAKNVAGESIVQPKQEEKKRALLLKRMEGNRHQKEVMEIFERIFYESKKIQSGQLFDYNIVLIGFMGSGKSTISKALSEIFAMDVVEMDQLIAERENMSISEIFEA